MTTRQGKGFDNGKIKVARPLRGGNGWKSIQRCWRWCSRALADALPEPIQAKRGFWFLANRPSWERLPADLREVVARNWNEAALAERADIAQLNGSLQQDLAARGLVFNQPDPEPVRATLRHAGFYSEWRHRYGEEAWALLEASTGPLG